MQGSILGPLLFTFYVNDLPTACLECIIKLYADDSKAYKIIIHPSDMNLLQLSLDKLGIWAELWELDLSYDKFYYLQIGYTDESLSYKIGQHISKPCHNAKDLGITILSNLRPGLHSMQIVSNANLRAKLILKSIFVT